jgi:DNA-binding CsgD family transcriptional regulator
MSKSDSLRFRDVRAVFRLIGECRDLGKEPGLWFRRMLEGLAVLFGVVQAAGGEVFWDRSGRHLQPVSAYSVTAEAAGNEVFDAYGRDEGWGGDPVMQAIEKLSGRLITRTRRQLVSDADWYGSDSFDRYRGPARIDHQLVSVLQVSDNGATSIVSMARALGERDFSPRERRLLNLFHAELGGLIGGPLVSATDPSVAQLSPRLRDTLACLLDGDSEKQAAVRLGLSHTTVHQYVTALYRRFDVRSRAELLAHVIRRARHSEQALTVGHQERRLRDAV